MFVELNSEAQIKYGYVSDQESSRSSRFCETTAAPGQ
jgi:hypothetical protein